MKSKILLAVIFVYFLAKPFAIKAQAVNTQDSLALIALYDSTGGFFSGLRTWWNISNPVGTWAGITVTGTRVTSIYLDALGAVGTIPPEIGNLSALDTLVLLGGLVAGNNNFTGNIPPELGNLSNLIYLDLSSNHLNGNIPKELGNLTKLVYLNLDYNYQLNGEIPAELGSLSNLTSMNLSNNQLSGSIPSQLANLHNLASLDVSFNQLSGGIPSVLGNLSTLTYLDLSNNQLNGSIPTQVVNIDGLQTLLLDNNELSGKIPSSIDATANLQTLDLSINKLSGAVPPQLGQVSNFTLYVNQFTFADLESFIQEGGYASNYAPQANVPLIHKGNTLTVSVGGTLSYEIFELVNVDNPALSEIQEGDSVFTIPQPGRYYIVAADEFIRNLTLSTDTLDITSLPLNLLSFTGSLQHNTNILTWQTTQEINTQSFTVQRSGDGANFTAIGSVPGADAPGTNNYSLTDTKPLDGANYYRLKMFDKDGAFTYSGVVELNNSNTAFALQVYPNPAASSATLSFNSLTAGKYAVTITGSDGKTIKRIAGTAVTGTNTQQLDISSLAAGVYMVTFVSGDGVYNVKLVKQ